MTSPRLSKGARAQLALLLDAGAIDAQHGKEVRDLPELNPMTLGSLRRHKLVDSTSIKTKQRAYTMYWLTPLGVLAAKANAPATPKAKKAAKGKSAAAPAPAPRDLVGSRLRTVNVIDAPGFYRMASEIYHADPCPTPALSSGLAATIVERSPLHARLESPRFGAAAREPNYAMDIGSAVHAFAFGDPVADLVWIDAADWKDRRTRNWRAAARAEGKTAILKVDKARVLHMAEALRPVLERELGCAIGDAYGEITIAAQVEGGGWRRTRSDLTRGDARRIVDVKTTGMSAEPEATAARLFDMGAQIQEALTLEILDAIDPAGAGLRRFVFVAIEQDDPHAISVIELDPAARDVGAQQVAYAGDCWDRGVVKNEWPGFDNGKAHRAIMPAWRQSRWFARAFELGLVDENGVSR